MTPLIIKQEISTDKIKKTGLKKSLRLGASVLVLGLIGACSSVPDAVNPVEWYRSSVDMLTSDDEDEADTQTAQEGAVPGESDEFPDLNSVPSNAPVLGSGDSNGMGLIADPNKPEYASSIARQNDDGAVPVAAVEQPAAADLQPAPPAQPVEPVIAAPAPSATAPAAPDISLQSAQMAQAVPETQQYPSSAISNPLVIQGGVLPTGETYDEFRARLMAGLNQSSAQMALMPSSSNTTANLQIASNTTRYGSDAYSDTVVISGSGIRSNAQYVTPQATEDRSQAGFMQISTKNGQLMISPNANKIATIHFTNGSSNLDANDRKVLRQVIALQRQNGGVIQIIGHASSRTRSMDPVRHKMVNYKVSVSRADSIASALVRLGAKKDGIMIGAVSDTQPLFYEFMPTGEAGNRRAEIFIGS